MQLATRFRAGSPVLHAAPGETLSRDTIAARLPAIFAPAPHASRSARYAYVDTGAILGELERVGWGVSMAVQARTRDAGRAGHAKHLLRLRRIGERHRDETTEVVIVNSHDGSTSYQMLSGVIRFLCLNSMVVGDRFEEVRVPHMGAIERDIVDGVFSVVEILPRVERTIDVMKEVRLTPRESIAFGEAALALRFDDGKAPITPDEVIAPRRAGDQGIDLWRTFNRSQENLLRGGQPGRTVDAAGRVRRSRTRPLTGIDGSVALNRALWTLAERMAGLKGVALD